MLRVGVIGLGYWGPKLVRNFLTVDGATVSLCCDRRVDRLHRIRRDYPFLATTADTESLIMDDSIDVVVIATPLSTHYELAKAALEAGKHVWVEKPLASTVLQARELVDIAERVDRTLMVDHTFIYHPAIEKIKEILDRNELGDVCYYDSVRINLGLFQDDMSVLWDLAPHDLSMMEYLLGAQPLWVQAVGARHGGHPVESMAYLTMGFPGNVLGHAHVNWLSPVKSRIVIIGGTKRMLVYDDNCVTEKLRVYDRGIERNSIDGVHDALVQYRLGDMHAPAIKGEEALQRGVTHFIHCIREGRRPITDGQAGLRVVEVLSAADDSLRSNARVNLESTCGDKSCAIQPHLDGRKARSRRPDPRLRQPLPMRRGR